MVKSIIKEIIIILLLLLAVILALGVLFYELPEAEFDVDTLVPIESISVILFSSTVFWTGSS